MVEAKLKEIEVVMATEKDLKGLQQLQEQEVE